MHSFLTWKGAGSPFHLPQSSHMTGLEMNGQARIPLSRLFSASAPLKVLGVLGALSLAACVSPSGRQVFSEVQINPTSPAKADIEAVLARPGDFPTFAALPAPPSDLPTAEALKSEVGEAQADALYVTNSTAPATWELDADDDFVARARAAVGAADLQPPTDAEIAEAEAYAAAARARAKAPPVPK
jgi:hypothetical protein